MEQPFQYNGRDGVMTDANGLYYMRARYYNPDIKRFVNRDVVTGTISSAQTLNRYAYVNGNPISYVDPFGLSRDGDSIWLQGASFLADLTPGLGMVKGFQQAFTGRNYVTGERLSVADRWSEGVGSTLSLIPIPGLKYVGKYGTEEAVLAGKGIRKWLGLGGKGTGELKYWNKATEFNGTKVYQRNDIIDPNLTDKLGKTNLERMKQGLAPIGPDGKSINLHHTIQTNDSR
ncbi:hypothetical protein VK70_04505 [Paenibacillus durus ATCC 35681]|uniref:Pre-toxin TG domain-containing protein n=1 Tax=Paenibacillus durus ATCC 35681 TaxID=1333534 RepID=A0A0F7F787_PAEDU|nr:hypothetical protein VK70_04505 [Paenibacillus durus ATCC 35681]